MKSEKLPGIAATDLELFLAYARDAGNWSGAPLVGGNIPSTRENTARLTHLKRAGLLRTERNGQHGGTWIIFTPAGRLLAQQYDISLDYWHEG